MTTEALAWGPTPYNPGINSPSPSQEGDLMAPWWQPTLAKEAGMPQKGRAYLSLAKRPWRRARTGLACQGSCVQLTAPSLAGVPLCCLPGVRETP